MDGKDKFKHGRKIIFREEGDVGLLFDPDTGRINILNETGKFIWPRLNGEKAKNKIIEEMALAFDVSDSRQAEEDFDNFIASLGKLGFLENYSGISKVPRSVCFGITSKCNFNCKHCLNRNLPTSEPDMTTQQLVNVIDQMGEGGTKNLSLFGGEPLCHPHFRRIVERINKYPINISLNTNASLIDDDMAQWLKEHKIKGAVVSLDGSKPEIMEKMRGKDAFEMCLKGIEALRKEGMSVLLSVTLTKLNYKDVKEMAALGKSINGTSIRFNHVFFGGNAACFAKELYLSPDEEKEAVDAVWQAKEEFGGFINADSSYLCQKIKIDKVNGFKSSYDKITVPPCGAAGSKCAIRPDGWVTPCEIIWEVKCGNLKKKTLSDIWQNSDLMNSFRKPMELDLKDLPECKGCSYQYLCFIGHRCYPYYNPGGVYNRALYCQLRK